MLTYFQNSFAIRLDPKFAKNLLLSIPPHFEHATTVLCEMSSKNRHYRERSEANYHARLGHLKQLLEKFYSTSNTVEVFSQLKKVSQ